MSKTVGTHRAWGIVLVFATGLIAVASVLLSYLASPAVTFGVLIGAIGLWMIASFRIGAILLLLLSLPLSRLTLAELGPVPVSPVTVVVALLVALWLWKVLVGVERLKASWMQLPLTIFLLCGILTLYWAPDTVIAIKIVFIFSMGAAVHLVVSHTLRSVEEVRRVMWAIAGAAAAVGVYAIWGNITGSEGLSGISVYAGDESYDRVEGIFTHPNQMGGFLALTIPPMVALAISERLLWVRVLGYALIATAIAGLALSYSRGAWVGTGLGLLVLLPFIRKGFGAVLGVALVSVFAASGALLERLQSITSATTDPAVTSRFEFWRVALRMVTEHPLLGVGLGNFHEAYGNLNISGLSVLSASLEIPVSAHNLFINLAVEVGLIGAAAFGAMFVIAFLLVFRINRTVDQDLRVLNLGLAAGLVALLLHNLIDVTVYQGLAAIMLFTYLGILDSMGRFSGEQSEEHNCTSDLDRTPAFGGDRTSVPSLSARGHL